MMKCRLSIYFALSFISLAVLSATISAVTGAQSREEEEDDEDALTDELPDGIELRVFIHRPRVLKPNHLGTCLSSSNSNVNHFELAPWHLPGPIVWSLNRRTVPGSVADGVDGVLTNSFNVWYSDGTFTQGSDTRAKRARLDQVNAIMWKRLPRSTLGATFVWYSNTGEVMEVDTVFNKRHRWANFQNSPDCQSSPDAYDLQNIATHEFGHWIGLDDLYDDAHRDLTMYGFGAGGEVKKRTLGTGDVSGRNALDP